MCSKTCYLLALLATFSAVTSTAVNRCDNVPAPIFVDIKDCATPPCTLVTGTSALMDITFKALNNSYTLNPKVRAKVGPLTINYPLPSDQQNGCHFILNGYCPIEKNEILVYHLDFPINGFPKISVGLEFSLLGDNDEVFQCFKVDCTVT